MARYRVIPERSQLWAEARSSLHPTRIETTGFTGEIDAQIEGGAVTLGTPTRIELDADKLRSGSSLTDGELQRRLEVRRFPRVIGEVKDSTTLGPGRVRLAGDLTLHGATRRVDTEATARVLDERTIEIEGQQTIDMRDFGLTPPKLLMFRVYPDVKVRVRLVAERVD